MAKDYKYLSVLVVEDNLAARKLMKSVLEGLGVRQIFMAEDGRSAQDFLEGGVESFDIIICEWRMLQMTGLEFLKQVRAVYPDKPFIMVSAKADLESAVLAREHGVSAFIVKPYSPQQFKKKLDALVQQL